MRKIMRPALFIGTGLILALLSAALSRPVQPLESENLSAAVFFLQATTTPEPEGVSEIGSTDGIVVMGGVIVLIVIVPIILRRKHWIESTQ
jgi:hypothetical protein